MKLTYIIVSYNEKEYLEEAIQSCLCQDVSDFEIIIGDDGSSDGSIELIEAYAAKFPKIIRYFIQERKGVTVQNVIASLRVSNVIMRALELALGEYCVILSGDDYFYKGGFFHKAIDYLDNHSKYVAYIGSFEKVWEDKPAIVYDKPYPPKLYWGSGKYIHVSAFVFRKSVFDKRCFLQRFCDDVGLVYALLEEGKWKYDKEVMFAYRQRSGSIMHTSDSMIFRIGEVMILQDTLCKGVAYKESLAHFANSLQYVFEHRKDLDKEAYSKYMSNCQKYEKNILNDIYMYDRSSLTKKCEVRSWLIYANFQRFIYRTVVRVYHIYLKMSGR